MGDRVRPLLDIFEKHFPNSNTDDFTRMDYADHILFADEFGGSALGIWKIEDQLISLAEIERGLRQIAENIEALAPSIRNTLLSPVENGSTSRKKNPFLTLIENRKEFERPIKVAKLAAKAAMRAPRRRSGSSTTGRAVSVAFWCQNIWNWETEKKEKKKAPHQINAARSYPPFGRFLQDVLDDLKIGIEAASALDALARVIKQPPPGKEKPGK